LNRAPLLSSGGADTTCTWLDAELPGAAACCCGAGLLLVLVLSVLLSDMFVALLVLDRADGVCEGGGAGLPLKVRSSLALCA
jgi:hypothetical protein